MKGDYMPRWFHRTILGLILLIPLAMAAPVQAQGNNTVDLHVTINPESGPSGTLVMIHGSGAPPNTQVLVASARWMSDQTCTTPQDGQSVATVNSDGNGDFFAKDTANIIGSHDVGIAYFAKILTQETPQPMSNIACFQFEPAGSPHVNIYLVALDDNGQSGMKIGCGDSLLPISVQIDTSGSIEQQITDALNKLLSMDEQFDGQSGLYNALYQSDLSVESITLDNGHATVNLTGSLQVGGVCDEPRVDQQIRQTVLQFDGVDSATILLNGQKLFNDQGDATPPRSSDQQPVFQNLIPAPFETIDTGHVRLAVVAYANSDIQTFSFKLNGEELNPETGGPAGYLISAFTERDLEPGVYTLTATATDAEGDTFKAQWDFIVAQNGASGEWFTANGTPKAGQINATMRSLVEAFRWHLYGLSWDGADHPDLPTHVGFQGAAESLSPWVTGNTFDQARTTATLRSLVEAFRWHFYGQDWNPPVPPGPDMPTHATSFSGPDPIQPWFTDSGQPIPENITATMRSLVESFRWHFWGYSWDGAHHPEIPTHAYD